MGMVKIRSLSVPSCGHKAGSVARLNGRETSNSRPHFEQRKSYNGILILRGH
jgi:hypothetical protein